MEVELYQSRKRVIVGSRVFPLGLFSNKDIHLFLCDIYIYIYMRRDHALLVHIYIYIYDASVLIAVFQFLMANGLCSTHLD